ncbi:SDR family NAD(P)-dependent oxidoreductase [Lacticaseibacillus mingshuiensis]|uniref:SDR family NAD(P)-dependent oxidoreductase n=1 Tax=Lacticaseibacillus mingshuiensis TaxID=2799574 RepID=A0ABW4CM64_9LACO|nr:SDR family NAD(P)-dependent oxidoreductase [Lacticaseibacillus mingshuiensis]
MTQLTQQVPIASPFSKTTTTRQVMRGVDLTGKVAIVTGGYSGIGLMITRALVKAGATVVVPARTLAKAQAAVGALPHTTVGVLDLMDAQSIAAFAADFLRQHDRLDLLIECAGIMFAPLHRDARGNESQLATNYLGHFQLTAALYPALKKTPGARVVVVSSRAQSWNGVDFTDPNFERRDYDPRVAYAQSKAADILFAVDLDRRAKQDDVRAFAVHPGLVPGTGLGRFINQNAHLQRAAGVVMNDLQGTRLISAWHALQAKRRGQAEYDYFKSTSQGAASVLWAATSPLLVDKGGVFIEDCNIGTAVAADSQSKFGARPWSIDPALAKQLWTLGETLSGRPFTI